MKLVDKFKKEVKMFVKLNDRVFLNTNRVSRIKIEEIKNSIRIHFFDGTVQIAKSQKFDSVKDAAKWIDKNMNK
jgi:hypothetical protein